MWNEKVAGGNRLNVASSRCAVYYWLRPWWSVFCGSYTWRLNDTNIIRVFYPPCPYFTHAYACECMKACFVIVSEFVGFAIAAVGNEFASEHLRAFDALLSETWTYGNYSIHRGNTHHSPRDRLSLDPATMLFADPSADGMTVIMYVLHSIIIIDKLVVWIANHFQG